MIAPDQAVRHQFPADRVDGADNARVVRRQEADQRQQQQARVQDVAVQRLGERAELLAVSTLADALENFRSHRAPIVQRGGQTVFLGRANGTIDRGPCHGFGIGELLRAAADFPDAFVRLAPDRDHVIDHHPPHGPVRARRHEPQFDLPAKRQFDLPEHVQLVLLHRRVADPHRSRGLVPGEPGDFAFRDQTFAAQTVEGLQLPRRARDGATQPVAPGAGFVAVAGVGEGEQRETGVARPAEPVVPVADAADVFGQRRGGGGGDPAGRQMRQRLQRQ